MSPVGTGEKLGAHLKLASDMVDILRSLVESYDIFESDIKEALLLTLLDITNSMLITPAQRPLSDKLASVLCETTLWAWVRTKVQTEKLWGFLQTTFFSMFHLSEVVTQLRLKCQQLTTVVVRLLYPENKELARKRLQQLKEDLKSSSPEIASGSAIVAPPQPQADPIEKLSWDVDSAKFAWLKMLHVMRNVNKVTDPGVHATVLSVITETINTLIRAETGIPTEEYHSPLRAKRINLLNVFGAWLFEACALPDMPFIKGKADAYGALCRLVCMRHVNPLPVQVLRHFYAVVAQALSEPTLSTPFVTWAIIEHSAMMFSYALPGSSVLIPLYLTEFRRLLRPDFSNPPTVRRKAIQILGSLVCYANHMRDVDIPSVTNASAPEFRYQDITRQVWQILADLYNLEQVPEHRVMCLHTMTVLLQDELMNLPRSGNKTLISDTLKMLLGACTHPDEAVFTAAIECVTTLATTYKQLEAADESYVGYVVEYLATNLVRQVPELFSWSVSKEVATAAVAPRASNATPLGRIKAFEHLSTMIVMQFYAILEWLLGAPSRLLDGPNVAAQRVFDAIGLALVPPANAFESTEQPGAGPASAAKEEDKRRTKEQKKKDEKKKDDSKDTKSKQLPQTPGPASEFRTPEEIKDDAIEGACWPPSPSVSALSLAHAFMHPHASVYALHATHR